VNERVAVQGKTEGEGTRVLRALTELCDELGAGLPLEEGGQQNHPVGWPPVRMPREEDELLLAGILEALSRLADFHRRRPGEGEPAVRAVLDGAHMTIRSEILTGNSSELNQLLPALAFLVVLPLTGEGPAHHVAERATQLISCP